MKSLPRKFFFLFSLLAVSTITLCAQNAWINEIHYDNASTDQGEFVEVAIENASMHDLNSFTLLLYNGSDQETYGSAHTLDTFTEGASENGFTLFYKEISGIQNGDDAFSLDYNGVLIQFISYEGVFTASDGPAAGQLSTDIGVEETTSSPVGESLQLSGNGTIYSSFAWLAPAAETPGEPNNAQSFGAACSSPTIQSNFSTPSGIDIGNNQITLNWSRGDGDRIVILAKENSPVNEQPNAGISYSSNADFSSGLADEIGTANFVVYKGAATSVDVSGLKQGTEYYFAVFEYFTSGICYLLESETLSVTTNTSFDEDSEVLSPLSQIPSSDISSVANSIDEAVEVFKFDLSDAGTSDGEPTFLKKLVIEKSAANNVSDWSSVIKGAKLNDGNSDLTISNLIINQENIEFDLTAHEFTIPDGATESLLLSIWLDEVQIDEKILGFEIPENHSLESKVSGSFFNAPSSSSVKSNPFTIDVVATGFAISTVRSAQVNDPFSLSSIAVDANGNADLVSRNVNLSLSTGSGYLIAGTADLGPAAMIDGFYEWTDLEYNIEESIIIEVSDGGGLTEYTSEIDIIPIVNTVFFSEYIEGSSSNKALEIFNNSGETINLEDFSLAIYTNGSESISYEYGLSLIRDDLEDKANLVIVNTSANSVLQEIADEMQFSITNFNGDDAIALLYKGTIIDLIGAVGIDPGTAWDVSGVAEATQDKTLVRKASVKEGNPNGLASFGTNQMNSEWIVKSEDDFSYLGDHFLCSAPNSQVSTISVANLTETNVEISWNRPDEINSIVLLKEGSEIDFEPVSGTAYSPNSNFSLADETGNGNKVIFAGAGASVIISNLNSGTNYHIAAYTYDETGNCYNLDSPAISSFTTDIALDEDSEISPLTQPELSNLYSTVDEELEAEEVFAFQIADLATNDTESTFIDRMVFKPSANNSLPYENVLHAILKDAGGKISTAEIDIRNDSITVDFPENKGYEIASGESIDFSIAVWFNRFEVTDTQKFALKIPAKHAFVSGSSASSIVETLADPIYSSEIEIIEYFDRIEEIRNGNSDPTYVTTGFVSSNDFGIENTRFYIQKNESTSFDHGIAVYSDLKIPAITSGNSIKVSGKREVVNGSIQLKADTIIILDQNRDLPEAFPVSPSEFYSNSDLIGVRVQLDSMILYNKDLTDSLSNNLFQFTKGENSVLVKITPNNMYYDGNAQLPLGAVDLQGVVENKNDSIQLIVSLDNEIIDNYAPIFQSEPQIDSINGDGVKLEFSVDELSNLYFAVKNAADSVPELNDLKNPLSDNQILASGTRKIGIEEVGHLISEDIRSLSPNTEYSTYLVVEDRAGNNSHIVRLDFFTLNTAADKDVEVVAASEQISLGTINAFEANQNFTPVFNFTVKDGGSSDSLSTYISQIVIHASAANEVDFQEVLAGVQLYNLSGALLATDNLIFQDSLVFTLRNSFELKDADSNTFQLKVKLTDSVKDEQDLVLEIPAIQFAWQVEPQGSQLKESFSEALISPALTIDVVATELKITHTNEVYIGDPFDIAISAVDENGSMDISQRTVAISAGNGTELTGQKEVDLLNGLGVFENLICDQTGLVSFEIADENVTEAIDIYFIQPEIIVDTSSFQQDFGLIVSPQSSKIQSYQLATRHLKDSVCIVAPETFRLSRDSSFIADTDTLIFDKVGSGTIDIFVRFSPTESTGKFYQGNVYHISKDADTVALAVSGQEGVLNLSNISVARDKATGARVKVKGIVTGGANQFEDKRIIQDQSAGILIQAADSLNIHYGDSVQLEGVLGEENGWLKLIPEKEITVLSSDSMIVEPSTKAIAEIDASVESQRIRIENLKIGSDGYFAKEEYVVFDQNDDSLIFKLNTDTHPLIGMEIPFGKINVTGVIGRSYNTYYIYPEFAQDLEIIPRDTILNISVSQHGLIFENVELDNFSEPQSYQLEAENLPANLKILCSENFEISLLENSHYADSLELPIDERGDIPEIIIHVRFSPAVHRGGQIFGEIEHVSGEQRVRFSLEGTIESIVAGNSATASNDVLVYPNPVSSKLNIELLEAETFRYEIIELNGEIKFEGELKQNETLELDHLDKGVYLLVLSNKSTIYYRKLIKK